MLTKEEVLPVGSVVTVHFDEEAEFYRGDYTPCVIIGHLSIKNDRKCFYDYICVEYPYGMDEEIFYINQEDIIEVLWRFNGLEKLHKEWMECKYGEIMTYYKHYPYEFRPDITEMRSKTKRTGVLLRRCEKIRNIKRWLCAGLAFAGIVTVALCTKNIELVVGSIIFAMLGWLAEK